MTSSAKIPMNIGEVHERLGSLSWIMGEWESISGVVDYPTMKRPVQYNEKLSFTSLGQPFLNYKSVTWNAKSGLPIHLESGFLKIDEDESTVAFLIAPSYGIATVEEGIVKDNTITTKTSTIGHMKFVKHKILSLERSYKLNKKGQLEYTLMMETEHTPLTKHLAVLFEKCT